MHSGFAQEQFEIRIAPHTETGENKIIPYRIMGDNAPKRFGYLKSGPYIGLSSFRKTHHTAYSMHMGIERDDKL
jgi:hypothetical protein